MATIKDIAKLAGVAQGTVSNVLNNKGNVSSDKIKKVQEACRSLGFVPNERARLLRKGKSRLLGVLLPSLGNKEYEDFYTGFKEYCREQGYESRRYLMRHEDRTSELESLEQAAGDMVAGLALFPNRLEEEDLAKADWHTVFVNHDPGFAANCIGFDYRKAAKDIVRELAKGYKRVCVLSDKASHGFYTIFLRTLREEFHKIGLYYTEICSSQEGMVAQLCHKEEIDDIEAFVCINMELAELLKNYLHLLHTQAIPIYTLSGIYTLPEPCFLKYELNYHRLGSKTAKLLLSHIARTAQGKGNLLEQKSLANNGFRFWFPAAIKTQKKAINILTLDSPTAYVMKCLASIYTRHTGIAVHMQIQSYNELYTSIRALQDSSLYDIIRMDVKWLGYFAEKIYRPLQEIDAKVEEGFRHFLKGSTESYSYVNGKLYAFPHSPSAQLLFYRKDLFEHPVYQRMYKELYKTELAVPGNFMEYNRIASFFTRALHSESPTKYGSTLTLGSASVAGNEYLCRLFSVQDSLFDAQGNTLLNTAEARQAMELLLASKQFSSPKHCHWWTDTAERFAMGDTAMAILYNNFAQPIVSGHSKVLDGIGYAMVPGDCPLIGGGSLGVSKHAKQPEEALDFIRWICSEPVASAGVLMGGVSPCKDSYENYEIKKIHPWIELSKKCYQNLNSSYIPQNLLQYYDEKAFIHILGTAVQNVLSGVQSMEEALEQARRKVEQSLQEGINIAK